MGCDEFGPLLLGRLEHRLGDEEKRRLERHLALCESCRQTLRAQSLVAGVLSERSSVEVSAVFTEKVMASLRPAPSWLELLNWRVWTLRFAPAAAALMLVAALGIGTTDAAEPLEFSDLVAAWVVDEGIEASPAFRLLWQQEVTVDTLLEAILTASSEEAFE